MIGDAILISATVVLVILGALTTLAHTAISRVERVKAHHLAQDARRGSTELVRIVEDPAAFLTATVLVRVICYVTATVLATSVALRRIGDGSEAVAAVAMTIVVFVLAELVPRMVSVQRSETVALSSARAVLWLGQLLRPITKLLVLLANSVMGLLPGRAMSKGPFATDEEIRNMSGGDQDEEEIEEEERELIHSIFEFGDTVVREVMVPRPDMVTIPADSPLEEALKTIVEAGYSRIPLFEGDNDNIIGVLYAKDLLKRLHEAAPPVVGSSTETATKRRNRPKEPATATVAALGRQPTFVPEQKKVAELLREMQQQRVHMAIVVDEYGGTAGLVTIEDLIEEIVGEIVDEYDKEEPLVEPIDEDTIRVDAKMPIDEVNELLDANLPHEEWDTVGGLVFGLTGRVPSVGERVRYDSLEFVTERVSGRRIQKVVISRVAPEPAPASE